MATEARVSFIDQLRKKLSSEITVDQMTSVLAAVSDVMTGENSKSNDNDALNGVEYEISRI